VVAALADLFVSVPKSDKTEQVGISLQTLCVNVIVVGIVRFMLGFSRTILPKTDDGLSNNGRAQLYVASQHFAFFGNWTSYSE